MDDDNDIKHAREFWRTLDKSKTAPSRNKICGSSTSSDKDQDKDQDKVDEAKRRNKEELVEVLRQRRQASKSPEPCVTSPFRRSHPVIRGKESSTNDLAHSSNSRDRWKRSTVATARSELLCNPTPTGKLRSVSPPATPYKVMNTHDPSSVTTKMAERMNSLKKIALKSHPPLRPTSSADDSTRTLAPDQQVSLKKRPFSTSTVNVSNSAQYNEALHPITDKNGVGSCDQHLLDRDSTPHSVQQFRALLDKITNQRRPCYLNSPIISQHLISAQRDRINSFINIEDYQATMVNVVIEVIEQKQPIKMTCRVGVSVSHVIKMAWERLSRLQSLKLNELILKVCGRDEYLDNDMLLSDYEYVHQCLKFGTDVHVTMVKLTDAAQTFSYKSTTIKEDHFSCFKNQSVSISKEQVNKILCIFFDKVDQYRTCIQSNNSKMFINVAEGLLHSVQLLCKLLSSIEPLTVSEVVQDLKQTTLLLLHTTRDQRSSDVFSPTIDDEGHTTFEGWNLTDVPNSPVGNAEILQQRTLGMLDSMTSAVKEFVADYCETFNMPFMPTWPGSHDQLQDHVSTVNVSTLEEPVRIKICCLHRPGVLIYHMYQVEAGLYYGGRQIGKTQISPRSRVKRKLFDIITWDVWLNFSSALSQLPLETRVCFTIHGNESLTRKPVGWVAMPIFDMNRQLQTGEHYLCVWPGTEGANPIGTCDANTSDPNAMILQVSFDRRGNIVLYDNVTNTRSTSRIYPSVPTEHTIKTVALKDHFTDLTTEEQQLLWSNRHSLNHILSNHPRGLPLLLLSVPDYDHYHLADVHAILEKWMLQEPTDALELLNVQFADIIVRDKALLWLQRLSSDDLYDLLPQLVQVVKYDWPGYYGTIQFLLLQAAISPHIAHMLFWLTHPLLDDPYFGLQYKMLWVGLKIVCSGPIGQALDQQLSMVESLRDVAMAVKTAKDRQATLVKQLQQYSMHLSHTHYRLPLSLSMLVSGIEIEKCSFFNSNTVPLKLTFINHDPTGTDIPIIFKIGDDLRQDMLTLQLIKLMEKLWLRAGLDLKMLTYRCLPTGPNQGILEMVTEAETLRSIQTSHGLTGALNEKRLAEWLMKHNNTDIAYKKATDCFIRSCAGYCVATYVLGICDRHNDNIMVKKSGHMFHIDFGRIFGNAQMFGSIKRDRAPFVLTSDMAYVINGGDTPTTSFQKFTDLCCAAYNELRRNCNLFINLLELMLTNGMPELSSSEDVQYVRDALLPGATDTEATIAFTRCIEASLGSKATQINFFIHNLAQMKFSGSVSNLSNGLLSFCPTSYSFTKEEKVVKAVITKCLKRYYPQRYYVYLIEITRSQSPHSEEQVFRRYSEFHEMHTKLVSQFPDHTLPALPGKIYVGRSQVRQVSERRKVQLNEYLQSLLKMDSIVAESDILYTFLHQMIRDETDGYKMEEELSESNSSSISLSAPPKVKLHISYNASDQLLSVMVRHVRNLVPVSGTNTANPYVKVYLLPDPYKSTKRKTKVAKRTLHPTYNETLTYKVPQADLMSQTLYLCVWDHGSLPKHCLGAVTIEVASLNELTTGIEDWYVLGKATS